MINEQTISTVFGLFYDKQYEGSDLLGIFLTRAGAETARQDELASLLKQIPEDEQEDEREYFEEILCIKELPVGRLR
jgi:hypothetical protein